MNIPADRFENVRQIGGITTATLDRGREAGSRVAFVNTGGGLRYTIALDRGADLVDAALNQRSLAYLTPNGIKPPNHAHHHDSDWLTGWPGGLMTTCGPVYIGHNREEKTGPTGLHGHHSNTPAEVNTTVQPDPWRQRHDIGIDATIADTRGYGPNVVVERAIRSTLGHNAITITDRTTNRDPRPNPHALMYHCNLGWPLLDEGAKLVLSGRFWPWPDEAQEVAVPGSLEGWKDVPAPTDAFIHGSRGGIITPNADREGIAHVGIINPKLGLALELSFKLKQIPRVMLWQNFCPGMYVCGIEPMAGSPYPTGEQPRHEKTLKPGQTRTTQLNIRVHSEAKAIAAFAKHDGKLSLEA